MNPEEILAAMAEVYACCGSYRDCGQVVTRFIYTEDRLNHTSYRPFRTAFIRPGRFRFEYRGGTVNGPRHIVWGHGGTARTWWHVRPGVERHESLALALGGATGVSGGSAHTVPALLLPDQISGRRLTTLAGLTSVGDEPLNGAVCYRLRGRFAPRPTDEVDAAAAEEYLRLTGRQPQRCVEGPLTLWIDRVTLLLRRGEEHKEFETFQTDNVTMYEPEIGIPISEDELKFDAPEP